MSLPAFVEELLTSGRVVLAGPPWSSVAQQVAAADRLPAVRRLESAHLDRCLDLAGPELAFDAELALKGAELVWRACWFLVSHRDPDVAVAQALALPAGTPTPGQHLSADLALRYLPQVWRRAASRDTTDVLTTSLARVLREWPLSGVLADLPDGPLTPLDFGGHPGLLLLYAERLADNPLPAWVPGTGPGRDWVELVFAERGLQLPNPKSETRNPKPEIANP
jgi:hypothetical protein